MSDVTHILDRVHQGDPKAAEGLLALEYDKLREFDLLDRHQFQQASPDP
jgi:hypothetical protein